MIAYTKLIVSHPYVCPASLLDAVTACMRSIPANVLNEEVLVTTMETRITAMETRQQLGVSIPRNQVSLVRGNNFKNKVHYEMVVR